MKEKGQGLTRILVAVCSLLMTTNAFAQQPADSTDLRQNIKIGQKVTARLTDRTEFKGTVLELSEAQLVLATKSGTERIAAARIGEVSWRHKDKLWNGLIVGAVAGGLMGLASNAANDCDYNECGESAVVPGGIAIGAALGIGLDLLWHQKQVLYRAPQSKTSLHIKVMAGQVKGAKVSWRF